MSKKRILYFLTFFSIISIFFFSLNAKAHNPADMSLIYISTSNELRVTITHNVGDPNTHYIKSATVRVNGSIVITQTYISQPTTSSFTYEYNVTANIGASIQVTAVCNQGGSIERSLVVSEQNGQTGEPEIPGFIGIPLITGILTFILTMLIFKRNRGKLKICP